jgi:two-component system KDP operon response regulator KdpE
VLIVDAEIALRFTLRRLFESQGWSVTLARGVEDAQSHLASAPDWLIIDPQLPDGDGEEVLHAVRSTRLATRIAVISSDFDAHPRLEEFAPDLLMAKPIAFDRLVALCTELASC